MSRDEDRLFHSALNTTESLTRVKSVSNFSTLLSPRHQSRHLGKRSADASIGRSEENGSESSQALYMKEDTKNRRTRKSLSEVSHNSARRMDGPSDGKHENEYEAAMEVLAANIIDREIYEWVVYDINQQCFIMDTVHLLKPWLLPKIAFLILVLGCWVPLRLVKIIRKSPFQ